MTALTTPVTPLDPVIVDMQARWKASGIPDLYEGGNGPVSRERARNVRCVFYPKPQLPQGLITPGSLPGPGGDIPVRVVRPVAGEPIGTVVYFHGGGWILGDLDSHEAHAIRIANRCGVVVLNVDYRLAPEHPFPAAPEDAAAALEWAHAHLAELGGAGKPLAVAGDSAGGNLAAVAAQHARAMGIALAAQLLIYPATDQHRTHDSHRRNAQGYLLTADTMTWFHDHYITDPAWDSDWRASPLLADSLAGLPPALVLTAGFDPLRDEGVAYAQRLSEAGVNASLLSFERQIHGFILMGRVIDEANEAVALCADALKRALQA